MIEAEMYNKIPKLETREDVLTSNVFGLLGLLNNKYLLDYSDNNRSDYLIYYNDSSPKFYAINGKQLAPLKPNLFMPKNIQINFGDTISKIDNYLCKKYNIIFDWGARKSEIIYWFTTEIDEQIYYPEFAFSFKEYGIPVKIDYKNGYYTKLFSIEKKIINREMLDIDKYDIYK